MQEVYLTIWQQVGSFDPARSSPITWLTVIARSRAIDRLRSSRRAWAALPIEAAGDTLSGPTTGGRESFSGGGDFLRLKGDTRINIDANYEQSSYLLASDWDVDIPLSSGSQRQDRKVVSRVVV